jgi:hypothetical protein
VEHVCKFITSNAVRICIERTISALDSSGYALKNKNVAYAPTYKDKATGDLVPKEMFYYKDLVIPKDTALSKPFKTLRNFTSTGLKGGTFTVSELWNVLKHYQAGCVIRQWGRRPIAQVSDWLASQMMLYHSSWNPGSRLRVWVDAVQVVVST